MSLFCTLFSTITLLIHSTILLFLLCTCYPSYRLFFLCSLSNFEAWSHDRTLLPEDVFGYDGMIDVARLICKPFHRQQCASPVTNRLHQSRIGAIAPDAPLLDSNDTSRFTSLTNRPSFSCKKMVLDVSSTSCTTTFWFTTFHDKPGLFNFQRVSHHIINESFLLSLEPLQQVPKTFNAHPLCKLCNFNSLDAQSNEHQYFSCSVLNADATNIYTSFLLQHVYYRLVVVYGSFYEHYILENKSATVLYGLHHDSSLYRCFVDESFMHNDWGGILQNIWRASDSDTLHSIYLQVALNLHKTVKSYLEEKLFTSTIYIAYLCTSPLIVAEEFIYFSSRMGV